MLLQNFSVGGATFTKADVAAFECCAGLSIPPLQTVGESFVKAYFKVKRSEDATSSLLSILNVWCSSVKHTGYSPLGDDGLEGVSNLDEEMKLYWTRGY